MEVLLQGLSYIPEFAFHKDVSYVEFLNRVRDGEMKLRSQGEWDVPHPWLNLFVPKSRISDFNNGVLNNIILKSNITTGPVLIYPMNKNKYMIFIFTLFSYVTNISRISLCHYGSCVSDGMIGCRQLYRTKTCFTQ